MPCLTLNVQCPYVTLKVMVGYPQFVGVAGGDSGRTLYSSLENVFTLLNHAILSISIYFGGDS